METHLLRAFVTIAELGSISRSAEALAVSQPTLTRQIQRLEESLGGILFTRGRHGSELTLFGARMLSQARETQRHAQKLESDARLYHQGINDRLRIGFGFWAIKEVTSFAARFRQNFPAVSLELRDMSSMDQFTALNEGLLDIGFMRLRPCEGLSHLALKQDGLLFVFSSEFKSHISSLHAAPLVLMSQTCAPDFWLQVQSYFTGQKHIPQLVQTVNEFHSAIAWAATGNAITIVPQSMSSLLSIMPELHSAPVDDVSWPLGIMWRAQPHRQALMNFIAQIKTQFIGQG
ncbi:LysR family transcriptional regulator [Raoultella terrigena]|uniref:LysR family transcriptional regulator n=1 Tax=Raoultella terrigena TaxID=577 RepID=UPI001F52061F|nr:LysR family transcriptional regulator [Raoultella terrigena]MCI1034478.1 LysR family transcriptional regulator [Raoultella terrigena]